MLPNYQERYQEIHGLVYSIAEDVIKGHQLALEGFRERNRETLASVGDLLADIEDRANKADNEIVRVLALFGPEASELRELIATLKVTNELVRISDGAKAYAKRMIVYLNEGFDFSPYRDVMVELHQCAIRAVRFATLHDECGEDFDDCCRRACHEEDRTDDLHDALQKALLSRMCDDQEQTVAFFKVLGTVRKLERVADHAVNISKLMAFAREGGKIQSY